MLKYLNDRMPPVALLRERVSYDPMTGELRWRPCGVEHFKNERGWKVWHSKFAGKPVMKRRRGYVVVTISVAGREIHCQGHRVVWALMTGAWPEHEVDHEDRDKGNNRWKNLRPATHQQNQWNKGPSKRNRTGIVGVHKHTQNDSWIAQIAVNGKTKHLGSFERMEEAQAARQAASMAVHGQFAEGVHA